MNGLSEIVDAVIVTYNCSPSILDNIAALHSQVRRVVIIDNASNRECRNTLELAREYYSCEIVYNATNAGIAAALNIGVNHALKGGADWILTFDQDSQVSPGFVPNLLQAYGQDISPNEVGMILPAYSDPGSTLDLAVIGSSFITKDGVILTGITSGSLTKAQVFQQCGTFEDRLFIDCVDTEFCLRINRDGWRIRESRSAVLHHSLGRITNHRVFGRTLRTTNHSSARRYYRTRNRLLLWFRYGRLFPAWLFDDIIAFGRETASLLLLEEHKPAKIKAILRGIMDAASGRFGYRAHL